MRGAAISQDAQTSPHGASAPCRRPAVAAVPPDVLVLLPTHDEAENIERLLEMVLAQLPEADVLVIDDNSPDGTGELVRRFTATDARVHMLQRRRKEGLGRAYLAGFHWALERRYGYILQLDADFSHDPKCLPAFVRLLGEYDVVVGSRRVPGAGVIGWGFRRRLLSWAGSAYTRAVLGLPTRDPTSGFIGWRRAVLDGIDLGKLRCRGYAFLIELKFHAHRRGFRFVESAIVFRDRDFGKSKMSADIILEALVHVWLLRLRT